MKTRTIILTLLFISCHPEEHKLVNTNIYLVPVGNVESESLQFLTEQLKTKFGRCILKENIEIPQSAFNPKRGQYLSTAILSKLEQINVPKDSKILGVTNVDLYVSNLNFVFGEASLAGKTAVISLARLKSEFYGSPPNESLFRQRMVKEAVHELGHTFGLGHCPDKRCVMHFSNSLRDTDIKSDQFCQNCLKKLDI
jgi:archaemetzincin